MFNLNKLNPANINPNDIPEDKILEAFEKLTEYCSDNNIDMKEFLGDDSNIVKASEIIHSKLNMAQRAILSKKKICSLIETHIDFIRAKVDELSKQQTNTAKKTQDAVKGLDDLF